HIPKVSDFPDRIIVFDNRRTRRFLHFPISGRLFAVTFVPAKSSRANFDHFAREIMPRSATAVFSSPSEYRVVRFSKTRRLWFVILVLARSIAIRAGNPDTQATPLSVTCVPGIARCFNLFKGSIDFNALSVIGDSSREIDSSVGNAAQEDTRASVAARPR